MLPWPTEVLLIDVASTLDMHADFSLSVSLAVLQATELLREITAVDPRDYEQQQHADAAGVRSVAAFIADLSDRYWP